MPKGVTLCLQIKQLTVSKFQAGIKQKTIAEQLNLNRSVVSKTLKLYRLRKSLLSPPKTGRPRKTTSKSDKKIINRAKLNPFLTAVRIKSELDDVDVSVHTIRRRLKEDGLSARKPSKKPFISRKNRTARLQFAHDHLNWSQSKWNTVLFSDESKFNLYSSDGILWVRRPINKRFDPKYTLGTIKHGGGNVQVWGCFSGSEMGPIIKINGIMDRYKYLEILTNTMLPYAEDNMPLRWCFQHDNDPKHTAKIVKKFFEDEGVTVMKWPAQSPDLNPIENLWDLVDQKIRAQHPEKFNNSAELFEAIKIAWNAVPKETIEKLIGSMRRRCLEVIKNKGYATKY